jgi:hypothetical protein
MDKYEYDHQKIELDSVEPSGFEQTAQSCRNLMLAAVRIGYVKNVDKIGKVRNQVNDIKYYTRQYGGIIIECRAEDWILNNADANARRQSAIGYDLIPFKDSLRQSDDVTKGFITCGYDATYLYLQNNLGRACGSCGFHRISWDNLSSILLRGWVFRLT